MQEGGTDPIQAINPLLKILKERQQLYFQLLFFVNKHFQSSCDDIDNINIFNAFLKNTKQRHHNLQQQQNQLIQSIHFLEKSSYSVDQNMSRNLQRFCNRIIENLDTSISRARKTVFDDGKLTHQFNEFKKRLQRILKNETFEAQILIKHVLAYCRKKYQKQLAKVDQYFEIIQHGSDICLRQIYFRQTKQDREQSDVQQGKPESSFPKKRLIKVEIKQQLSQQQSSPQKKNHSLKKTRLKKRLSKKHKDQQIPQTSKQKMTNQLYKYYSVLELNKPQFYQDYIYNQLQQQKHRTELMSKLRERNKTINTQINVYVKKVTHANFQDLNQRQSSHASSGEDKVQLPLTKKLSSHRNFTIKRKSSGGHFDSSSATQKHSENQRTILASSFRNFNHKRKSSQSNHRPMEKSQQKCFVVQQPKIFQDQVIPQIMPLSLGVTHRFNPTRTMRPKQKKNQNLRLKRLNNPVPLQNTFLQKFHP